LDCAAHHGLQDDAAVLVTASDQLEETMACNFPKRADEKNWTDRELRLEELEAVSGGATPGKHQQPREYVQVQLKEVFIS
jgi:hypothetical protein